MWKTARESVRARDTCQEPFCRQSLQERRRTKRARERRKVLLSTFIPPRNFWCALGCSQGMATTRRFASRHDVARAVFWFRSRLQRTSMIALERLGRSDPGAGKLVYTLGTGGSSCGQLLGEETGTSKVSCRDFVAYNLSLFRLNPERCIRDECASVLRTWGLAVEEFKGVDLATAVVVATAGTIREAHNGKLIRGPAAEFEFVSVNNWMPRENDKRRELSADWGETNSEFDFEILDLKATRALKWKSI